MWSNKKPGTPRAADRNQKNVQMNHSPRLAPASCEETPKLNKDVMHPTKAIADGATSRLGSSLYLKGEIVGNEDLFIEGRGEGLVQLDERKVMIGATAKLTADIIAGVVMVYGNVKGNICGRGKIESWKDGWTRGDCTR